MTVPTDELETGRLGPEHAEAGFRLSAEAGWNQTAADWRLMLAQREAIGQFTRAGELVTSALLMPYGGRLAWVAMVLTGGRWRRRGLATANLLRMLERAEALGLLAGLDATPAGREVYRPLGFAEVWPLHRLFAQAPAAGPVRPPPGVTIRRMAETDLAAATALDAASLGAERSHVLTYLREIAPERAFVAEADGRMIGCVCARPGRISLHIGPLIASDAELASALLARALDGTSGPVSLDVPDAQTGFVHVLAAAGFQRARPFMRMVRGDPAVLGDPAPLFALAGPELA